MQAKPPVNHLPPYAPFVWIASFPKSGNTWFLNFLHAFLRHSTGLSDSEVSATYFTTIASDRKQFDNRLGVPSADLTSDEIDLLRPQLHRAVVKDLATDGPLFAKAHDAYIKNSAGDYLIPPDVSRAAIYLVRNPLDVAVSFHFYSGTDNVGDLVDQMTEGDHIIGGNELPQLQQNLVNWSEHYLGWTTQTGIPTLIVRYEDLLDAPALWFGRSVEFLALDGAEDIDLINKAIEDSNFERMQKNEAIYYPHGMWSKTGQFYRKGKAGDWRNHLTEAQASRIIETHRDVMTQLDYLDETGAPRF
ncbi:MAG: sulfotransferase domain-containing protein [Alphaproteobacteria bacterium]